MATGFSNFLNADGFAGAFSRGQRDQSNLLELQRDLRQKDFDYAVNTVQGPYKLADLQQKLESQQLAIDYSTDTYANRVRDQQLQTNAGERSDVLGVAQLPVAVRNVGYTDEKNGLDMFASLAGAQGALANIRRDNPALASVLEERFGSLVSDLGGDRRLLSGVPAANPEAGPAGAGMSVRGVGANERYSPIANTGLAGVMPRQVALAGPTTVGVPGRGPAPPQEVERVVARLIQRETNGTPGAQSQMNDKGRGTAKGIIQVLDATGQDMARKLGIPWRVDLMMAKTPEAAEYQYRIGRAYFDQALAATGGDVFRAAQYYYGGPGFKDNEQTREYARRVTGTGRVR